MKRLILFALVLISLAGCSSQEQRPEGIVERWLLALNQGSAGEPGRYAPADVSDAVLPGWENLDPGEFDVIEVGRARPCPSRGPAACEAAVPFRVIPVDGDEVRLDALVGIAGLPGDRVATGVVAVTGADPGSRLPSEGGGLVGSGRASDWLIAVGIGLAILLVAELLMRFVRSTASD